MTMSRKLSSVVIAGVVVAAAAALPTTALAQQTDSVAVSPSDTAKGEALQPASGRMILPRSAVQQLIGQMFGKGSPRQGATQAPRAGQGADSAATSKRASDSTAADSTDD